MPIQWRIGPALTLEDERAVRVPVAVLNPWVVLLGVPVQQSPQARIADAPVLVFLVRGEVQSGIRHPFRRQRRSLCLLFEMKQCGEIWEGNSAIAGSIG